MVGRFKYYVRLKVSVSCTRIEKFLTGAVFMLFNLLWTRLGHIPLITHWCLWLIRGKQSACLFLNVCLLYLLILYLLEYCCLRVCMCVCVYIKNIYIYDEELKRK